LGNSTDAFLLLKLYNVGVNVGWIAGLWAIHHVVKVLASTMGGWMSDHVGRRPMLIAGWIYYALIYLAFALVKSEMALIIVFVLYGGYYGLVEGPSSAWVADLAPKKLRGEAFGWYYGAIGIGALPASIIFGELWSRFGPALAFGTGALLALLAGMMLFAVPAKISIDANMEG
jgi:MFS family permease